MAGGTGRGERKGLSGRRIAHYELLSRIGRGGMGEVYRARDLKLGRAIAVKVLARTRASDPEWRNRFRQEAKTAAALNHPSICTIHDVGEDDGRSFIAMELLEGRSLDEHLASGPMKFDRVLRFALQLADALAVAHLEGIVHRDLKPHNIFVTKRGIAKIVDFGLALLVRERELDADRTVFRNDSNAAPVGTLSYMSPEQARGEAVDARSDVHSLGAVLYEMATGRRAFRGRSAAVVFDAILNRKPVSASRANPNVPPGFSRIVAKMLAKDPAARYASAVDLQVDLKKLKRSPPVRPAPPRVGVRVRAPSIAVLPFRNMSVDPAYGFFCDGLTEDVINSLAAVRGLRVASSDGRIDDARTAGGKLNVESLLEGSVRKGKRLRITVQLVSVADGYHVWSGRYDRVVEEPVPSGPVGTILGMVNKRRYLEAAWERIQDEVSAAIVEAVKAQLLAPPASG